MVERGVWKDTSSGNWNNILTPGMYALSEWGSNGPTSAGYECGTVAVFKSGSSAYGGAVTQIYFPHANAGNGMYAAWRTTYQESSSRWTNWHYLLDTGNYAAFLNNYYVRKTGDNMTGSLTNTANFTAGGGFYLTSSHGRMIWDSGTSAMWLQGASSGNMYLSGFSATKLTLLEVYASRMNLNGGALYISNTGIANTLNVQRTDTSTGISLVAYSNSSGALGYIGVGGSASTYPNEPSYMYTTTGTTHKIYHSGNISDLEQRGYLMSNVIWIDATDLNENTWYPVTVSGQSYTNVYYQVFQDLGMSTSKAPSWATHDNGFTVHLEWYTHNNGWGVCPVTYFITRSQFDWCNLMPVRGLTQLGNSSTIVFYVRGGGLYQFKASNGTPTVTLRTSSTTIQSQTVLPTATAPMLPHLGWSYAASGNNGGNTTSWQFRIDMTNGSAWSTGEITAYQSSDERLKTNIKKLNGLSLIRKLQPVEFDWTDEAIEMKPDKTRHSYGLIAQEVESIVPDIVHYNMFGKGYLSLDYNKLIPITLSAVKEVDNEVTRLKKRVKELENKISKYEKLNRQRTTGINISDATVCS